MYKPLATAILSGETELALGTIRVNHHPRFSPGLATSDFHLFLHLKKFLFGQRQRFLNNREAQMSVTVVPIPDGRVL